MSRNVVLALVGVVVVGSFVGGGAWFLTSWQKSVFASNRLNVQLCDCSQDSLVWEEGDVKALLEFYQKDDVSGSVDYLVPFVQTNSPDGYAIPSNGMSWIAQAWAPSTYRAEYRQEDQKRFWSERSETDPEYQKFKLSLSSGLPKCEELDNGFLLVSDIILGTANAQPLQKAFTSIQAWRAESLNPAIEKSDLTSGDRVLVRINCVGYQITGCMDEKACNYDPKANKDDGECNPKDECGKCNGEQTGPGKVFDCGCNPMPNGDCDCRGNKKDAAGDCGGDCLKVDSSGNCIAYTDRDGDGVWDREDRCPNERAQGDGGDGCPMDVILNNDMVRFEMQGASPGQKIGFVIRRKGVVQYRGTTKASDLFPRNKTEANQILQQLTAPSGLDIQIHFYNREGDKPSWSKEFVGLDWICVANGNCGPFNKSKNP